MGKWIIRFDYRSDDGNDLVGPFDSRADAETWLVENPITTSECTIEEMQSPGPVRHNIFEPDSMGD